MLMLIAIVCIVAVGLWMLHPKRTGGWRGGSPWTPPDDDDDIKQV